MLHKLFGAWRRVVRDISRLQLWEVLRRRGTRRLASHYAPALRYAVERCMACTKTDSCDRLLAAGEDRRISAFCPNTMYLHHLDAMQNHAPKRDLLGPGT